MLQIFKKYILFEIGYDTYISTQWNKVYNKKCKKLVKTKIITLQYLSVALNTFS